jgi:hypothetical protein
VLHRADWGKTPWTRVERDAIYDRGLREDWHFLLFAKLESEATLPDWIPKRRIYYDVEEFGVPGLAGAVKTRIIAMDGESHQESSEQHAARAVRAREFAAAQKTFRHTDGVRMAPEEINRLAAIVDRRVERMNQSTSYGLTYERKKKVYFRVIGTKASVVASWRASYGNTLDDSELELTLWQERGRRPDAPDPRAGYGFREPQMLAAREFDFTLLRLDAAGWIERRGGKQFQSEALAEDLLHWLVERDSQISKQS